MAIPVKPTPEEDWLAGLYIAYVREQVRDARVSFQVADVQALPFEDGTVDAAVSGLVLNFVPDKERALSEMARVVRPDGLIAAYVWDYAGEMQLMRIFWDAAVALDPAAYELDEGRRVNDSRRPGIAPKAGAARRVRAPLPGQRPNSLGRR